MKHFFFSLAFVFTFGFLANAQSWNNLSFDDSHQGLENNPLKGFTSLWQPWNSFPHSIQGTLFGLDEIMLGMNTFDWTVVDTFLAQEAAKGKHSYLQVNIDPANGSSQMPGFLINQVDWEFYQDSTIADSCPDWNDPDLMNAMLTFIDSFGTRYNSDSRVFLVHLGLYGMWGEWHIGEVENIRPEFAMTEANKALISNAFKAAFPDRNLLARYPENMPDPQTFGYSDGLFFGQSISPTIPWYFHNILKAANADENWRLHPIGGEMDPALQPIIFDTLPNQVGQDVYQCFDSIRPTWLFCHHLVSAAQPNTAEWDNALLAQKAMGYTFYVDRSRLSAANGNPAIEVNIRNTGLCPIYANWDLEFGALDVNNQLHLLGRTKWDLNLIQPDALNNYRTFLSDSSLTDGNYTFLLRVVNPLESHSAAAPSLTFANASQDADLVDWLTLGQATISGGNAGAVPIPVTSISLSPSSALMQVGDVLPLSAQVLPANATQSGITWVSDHPGTASVDSNGLLTAGPGIGMARVSAYTQNGGFVGHCEVTVTPVRVEIPALIEAESYVDMFGVVVEPCQEGGENLGFLDTGDWMEYGVVVDSAANFFVDFRIASPAPGGEITIVDAGGDTLDTVPMDSTGAWQVYSTLTSNSFSLPAGGYELRFYVSDGGFNLNWIEFYHDPALGLESGAFDFDVYPNPTSNRIQLKWRKEVSGASAKIRMYDVFGAVVRPRRLDDSTLDLEHLAAGLYFLEVAMEGRKAVKKVILY